MFLRAAAGLQKRKAFLKVTFSLASPLWFLLKTPYWRQQAAQAVPQRRGIRYQGVQGECHSFTHMSSRRIDAFFLGIQWERESERIAHLHHQPHAIVIHKSPHVTSPFRAQLRIRPPYFSASYLEKCIGFQ